MRKFSTPPEPSPNEDVSIEMILDAENNKDLNNLTHPDAVETDPIEENLDEEVTPGKKKRKKKTKEFYVDEKEFYDELKAYYETDIITVKLADMLRKMINGLAHRPNFINYTFRDEATGDALVNIMAALHKKKFRFAENKNPFSYFNAIAWNCWRNRIKKEARARETLASYQDEMYSEMVVPTKTSDE